jgi:thiosulfate/3-mercaptopyruvate sulfurtransferase
MENRMSPIINATDLLNILGKKDLLIFDAGNVATYETKHIQGALFVDLNNDMAELPSNAANGGRHPLPSITKFTAKMQDLGVSNHSYVIVYDDKNASNAAARLWWMLKACGHKKLQVLNGGLQAAELAGIPMNSGIESAKTKGDFTASSWDLPLSDIEEVSKVSTDTNYKVIDVRDAYRYEGISEPIDLVAGHIPGAVNLPFSFNLNEQGLFKSQDELKAMYTEFLGSVTPQNTIVHCGSGVTACHTLLAMDYAGLTIPRLYVGSWSEWSRRE